MFARPTAELLNRDGFTGYIAAHVQDYIFEMCLKRAVYA
jgi:hypothetical protein